MSDNTTEIDAMLNNDGMNVVFSVALLAMMRGDRESIAELSGIVMGTLSIQIETLTGLMDLIDGMSDTLQSEFATTRARAGKLIDLAERVASKELAQVRAQAAERGDDES